MPSARSRFLRCFFAFGAAVLAACTSSGSSDADALADAVAADVAGPEADAADATADAAPVEPALITEARKLGLLDSLADGPVPVLEAEDGATTTYRFEPGAPGEMGPLCLRGDPFRFAVRDTGSDTLVVFLQGGGACWSQFCFVVTGAPPGIPDVQTADANEPLNPLAAWSMIYLPYCDGSFFVGEADVDEDGDDQPDRFHRGLANLSGALRTGLARFPAPSRVILIGSSAGGYGTLLATLLVRAAWPEASLRVMSDSGVGLARPDDPAFLATIAAEQNVLRLIPSTCEACLTDGQLTPLVAWTLERDPEVRVAVFSSYYDTIIGAIFLGLPADTFRDLLLAETGAVHDRFPDRYRRFLANGVTHTSTLGDPTGIVGSDPAAVEMKLKLFDLLGILDIGGLERTAVGDVRMADWLKAFVTDAPDWVERLDEPGPVPDKYPKALSVR